MTNTSPMVGMTDNLITAQSLCVSAFKSIPIPANNIIFTKAKSLLKCNVRH